MMPFRCFVALAMLLGGACHSAPAPAEAPAVLNPNARTYAGSDEVRAGVLVVRDDRSFTLVLRFPVLGLRCEIEGTWQQSADERIHLVVHESLLEPPLHVVTRDGMLGHTANCMEKGTVLTGSVTDDRARGDGPCGAFDFPRLR